MFITYFYQPFFNILIAIYWVLGQLSPSLQDMGLAVIIFAFVVRIFTLPLTLAGERSEEEKRKIALQIKKIKQAYAHNPIQQKLLIRQIMRRNKRIVLSTFFNLGIQLLIIIMLYRIFTTGLAGRDYHLLYSFMPPVNHVNLLFLGKYDLSHPNLTLNVLQSFMIFVVELLVAIRSPFPLEKKDIILMQLILPIASFFIFLFMPAGKKIFIITSLIFSALYHTLRLLQTWLSHLSTHFLSSQSSSSDTSSSQSSSS